MSRSEPSDDAGADMNRSGGMTAVTYSFPNSAGSTNPAPVTPVTAGPASKENRTRPVAWIADKSAWRTA
jgi:hypothetical protein